MVSNKDFEQKSILQQEKDREGIPPVFNAVLTPHRSLGRNGFVLLICFVFFTCFLSGVGFLVIGAWPVFVFMILDAVILWFAFHMNYRSGKAREEISIWRHNLKIRKISPGGRAREYQFNPFWARFNIDRHDAIGITRMAIVGQGQHLDIGGFLNPDDRESFAMAFGSALNKARGG